MKILFIMFVCMGMILSAVGSGMCDGLEDARRSANSAYDYSSRASSSKNERDARYHSRQAAFASGDAIDSAMGSKAYDAAGYAGGAYDYSTRASRAKDVNDARYYSRQAERAAQEAQVSIDHDIAKRSAEKVARDAETEARIKSESARKRAEEAIAEMEPVTEVEADNKTVEDKITGIFGR